MGKRALMLNPGRVLKQRMILPNVFIPVPMNIYEKIRPETLISFNTSSNPCSNTQSVDHPSRWQRKRNGYDHVHKTEPIDGIVTNMIVIGTEIGDWRKVDPNLRDEWSIVSWTPQDQWHTNALDIWAKQTTNR